MRRVGICAGILWLVSSLSADPSTLESVVKGFAAAYASIADYQCRMVENCRKGDRYEERTMNIYFKKPRLIRMDILTGNLPLDPGSVAVFKGGKVTGRKGGFLSLFALTLDKHDPQVTSVRGLALDEIDMQGVLEKTMLHIRESGCTIAQEAGTYVLTCEPRDPSRAGGVTRESLTLDAASFLPVFTEAFEGAVCVQRAWWSSYVLNAGLPDALFDVFWDPKKLQNLGIRTVCGLPVK